MADNQDGRLTRARIRKRATVVVAVVFAFSVLWCGLAVIELSLARAEFDRFRANSGVSLLLSKAEVDSFFAASSLCLWRSVRPLLKNPFRQDIRLYFVHEPRINSGGVDALADTDGTGAWHLKVY